MAFKNPIDQYVIDENDAAPAVKKRNKTPNSERLREATQAFEEQQFLNEMGITKEELYDE